VDQYSTTWRDVTLDELIPYRMRLIRVTRTEMLHSWLLERYVVPGIGSTALGDNADSRSFVEQQVLGNDPHLR